MNKPLVSIMIPTHNDAATLERCLRSVLEQDYDNLLVAALDNQSEDGTYDLLVDFEKQYRDRLYIGRTFTRLSRLALQDRCGGLVNPRTMFSQYLSATDLLAPNHVSRCLELFESNQNAGCVLTHADIIHPSGTVCPAPHYQAADVVIPGAVQMESFMADGMNLNAIGLYRTEVYALSRKEGFVFNRFPNWLALVMASSISDLGYIHDPLAFRGDSPAVLGERFIPSTEDFFEHYLFLQAFNTIAARLGRSNVCEQLPKAIHRLSRECIRCSDQLQKTENQEAARSYLSLALAFLPEMAETQAFKQVAASFEDGPWAWR